MRELETLSLHGRTLESMLQGLNLAQEMPHLLILDVPGVESALLSTLQLRGEATPEWIIIRGGPGPLMQGGRPIDEAIRLLQDRHYAVLRTDEENDPERPVYILGRDSKLIRLAEAERRILEMESSLELQTRLAAELVSQNEKLAAEKVALDARHSTLVTERDALTKERDEQAKLAKERGAGIEELKKQLAEARVLQEGLSKELEASKMHCTGVESKRTELASHNEKLAAEKAALDSRLSTLVTECHALTKKWDSLTSERDQLNKTASDRASQIAELEVQVAEQAERQTQIDAQMVRAEAQLEMLKDFMRPSFE
jgi:myosin heavy subunit